MSNRLREVCKRNKEEKKIALRVKEESLTRVYSRLKDNNGMSIRGLTKELIERLARFEIRRQIPNSGVKWDNAVDLDSDRETDSENQVLQPNTTQQPAHTGQGAGTSEVPEQAVASALIDEKK